MLGLVADNDIAGYHPIDGSGNNATGTMTNVMIDAVLTHGYNKVFTYDARLEFLCPPFFSNPTQSA